MISIAALPVAQAQELGSNSAAGAEIIVTAQGKAEKRKDVPISASVISGKKLTEGGLKNLQDIADRMPAVKITPAPAADC